MSIRLHRFRGEPYEAGRAVGREIGPALAGWHEKLIDAWPARDGTIDRAKLRDGALRWLGRLPERYRLEFRGLADGSGVPLMTIAASYYAEECCCSGFITMLGGDVWVGRNNDAYAPELWNGITVHEIAGRIPRIGFGVPAETFTTTGINRERLWLHYNSGGARDEPGGTKPCFQPHVVLSEALENCASIAEVESALERWERTRGMILFAVDGKTGERAIIDCGCRAHRRRPAPEGGAPFVAANHACGDERRRMNGRAPNGGLAGSIARHERMEEMFGALRSGADVGALQSVLADQRVEQRDPERTTVFSTLACPATGEMWFASGDGPAASTGSWTRVEWPW